MLNGQAHKQAKNETTFTANTRGLGTTIATNETRLIATGSQTAMRTHMIYKYRKSIRRKGFEGRVTPLGETLRRCSA